MGSGDSIAAVVRLLIVILCTTAFLLIVLIATGSELDETSGRALGTAVAVASFSLTGVAGTSLARRRPDLALLGYFSALASLVALVLVSGAIWEIGDDGDWHAAGVAMVFAVAGGHGSLLLASARVEDHDAVRLTRAGTLLAIALLSLMAIVEIGAEGDEIDPRMFGIVAVFYILGTLLLPLLRRASPAPPPTHPPSTSAVELLRENGHVLVEGPVSRVGTRGPGQSTSLLAPDGRLLELIVYDRAPDDG